MPLSKEEVQALLAGPTPIGEIAQKSGVSVPTLYRWAKDGPKPQRQRSGEAADTTRRRRELLADGVKPADVAAGTAYGLPPCTPSAMRQLRATVRK